MWCKNHSHPEDTWPCRGFREQWPPHGEGESPAAYGGLTRLGLSQQSMSPLPGIDGLWHNISADIMHDASCGYIMLYPRGANWTRYEQPDAANTEGTLIEASHPAAPSAEAQADGVVERSRSANMYSVRRLCGWPQPF